MASENIAPGTAFKLSSGQVAVKMAPNVTAGPYFIIDPVNGGGYATAGEATTIEASPRLTLDPALDSDKIASGQISADAAPVVNA